MDDLNKKIDGLSSRTAGGVVWSFAGNILKAVAQFIPIAVLARLVSPADFGIMTGVLVVIGICEQLAYSGFGPTLVQLPQLRKDHVGSAYLLSIASAGTVALAIALFAHPLERAMSLPGLAVYIPLVAIALPINAPGVISARLLQRKMNFRFQVGCDTISYVVAYYFIGIPMAYMGFGIEALVVAFLAQSVIRTLALLIKTYSSLTLTASRSALRELYGSGMAMMLGGIAAELFNNADRIGVSRSLGAVPLGVYGRASDLVQRAGRIIDQVIVRALYPAFAHRQDSHDSLRRALNHINVLAVMGLGAFSLFLAVYAREVIAIAFGPQWASASPTFALLSLAMILSLLFRIQVSLLQAVGRFWTVMALQSAFFPLAIGVAMIAAPIGLEYAAAGMILVQAVRLVSAHCCVARFGLVGFLTGLAPYVRTIPWLALTGAAALLTHYLVMQVTTSPLIATLGGGIAFSLILAVAMVIAPAFFAGPTMAWVGNAIGVFVKYPCLKRIWSDRSSEHAAREGVS